MALEFHLVYYIGNRGAKQMELKPELTALAVAASLREMIANGELFDGARLVERELAERFSVSRVPMREAIQRLEREGLVETRKNRGAVVKSLSRHDVEEIYHLRMLLEGDAIHRSVKHLDDDVITQAERAHRLLGKATSAERQGALNREFHQILYLPCRNSRQLEMIWALREQIERYERLQHRLLADTTAFQEEHAAILDACRQRNADAARSVTISHLESAKGTVIKLVRD